MNPESIEIAVPREVIVEYTEATVDKDGSLHFPAPTLGRALKVFPLRLGTHDLGDWVVDGIDAHFGRTRNRVEYVAQLRCYRHPEDPRETR